MAAINGNGIKSWILGVVGVVMAAGIVGAVAQTRDIAEKSGRVDQRVVTLESREPVRDRDHDSVIKLETELAGINKKLDKIADALGVKE